MSTDVLLHVFTFVGDPADVACVGPIVFGPTRCRDNKRVADVLWASRLRCRGWFKKALSGSLSRVPKKARANVHVVLAAVKSNGLALEHAADAMKKNEAVVWAAVRQDWHALHFARVDGWCRQQRRAVVIMAVRQDTAALRCAAAASFVNCDEDMAVEAVHNNWGALLDLGPHMRANKAVAMAAVRRDGRALQDVANTMKEDEDVVTVAVKQTWHALKFARMDGWDRATRKAVVMLAVRQNLGALDFAAARRFVGCSHMKDEDGDADVDVALEAVRGSGFAFQYLGPRLRGNKAVALEAVQEWCDQIAYASDELRADFDVVMAAMTSAATRPPWYSSTTQPRPSNVTSVLRYASAALLNENKELALAAVRIHWTTLKCLGPAMCDDRDVVAAATGCSLQGAEQGDLGAEQGGDLGAEQGGAQDGVSRKQCACCGNEECHGARDGRCVQREPMAGPIADHSTFVDCLEPWDKLHQGLDQRRRGEALQFASERLRSDTELVLACLQYDAWNLRFAGARVLGDRQVVHAAVVLCGHVLQYALAALRADESLVADAECSAVEREVQRQVRLYGAAGGGYFNERCLLTHSGALQSAALSLRSDKAFVLRLVQRSGWALAHVNTEFQKDRDVVLAAVKQAGCALKFASQTLRDTDKEIAVAAVTQHHCAHAYVGRRLQGYNCYHVGYTCANAEVESARAASEARFWALHAQWTSRRNKEQEERQEGQEGQEGQERREQEDRQKET